MALMDYNLELCDGQTAIVGDTSAVAGETVIDLGIGADFYGTALTNDFGEGGEMYLHIQVKTTFTGAGGSLACALQCSASENMGTPSTLATITIPALAAAGSRYCVGIPRGTIQRYLRLTNTAGAAITAGAIDAWISNAPGETIPTT